MAEEVGLGGGVPSVAEAVNQEAAARDELVRRRRRRHGGGCAAGAAPNLLGWPPR